MGQRCCSQNTPETESFEQLLLMSHINKTENADINFPVAVMPPLNKTVEAIRVKMKPFMPSTKLVPPTGIKSSRAYLINREGAIYMGDSEWMDGLPNGKGRLLYPDGSIYTGFFVRGVAQGEGRFINSAGWWYEGQILKEQADGIGIFMFEGIGYLYEGNWLRDFPHEEGREVWKASNGDRLIEYQGEFYEGKKHGNGKYMHGNQWVYEGPFIDNEIQGDNGSIKYRNGDTYKGSFKSGELHGKGVYTWANGANYSGEFAYNQKHGKGILTSADETQFEGVWVRGKREGKGVLRINGQEFYGAWQNDVKTKQKL